MLVQQVQHPATVYVREELIVEPLDEWLHQAFRPAELSTTIESMEEAHNLHDGHTAMAEAERQAIVECDRKLARYRAALDSGGDPAIVARWITEVEAKRVLHKAKLREVGATRPHRMTKAEIMSLTAMLGGPAQSPQRRRS